MLSNDADDTIGNRPNFMLKLSPKDTDDERVSADVVLSALSAAHLIKIGAFTPPHALHVRDSAAEDLVIGLMSAHRRVHVILILDS